MTQIPGLGVIPNHWTSERARWLLHRQRREVRPSDGIVTAFRDGQVTLREKRRTEGFTNAVQEIGYQGIRVGDLVVHGMDGFAGAIGVSDSDGKSSPVVHAYRSSKFADTRYLAYALRMMAMNGYVSTLAKGIRERSTAFDAPTLANVLLPVPPLGEQRRIADFLDAETTRIDKLVDRRKVQELNLAERSYAAVSEILLPGILTNPSGHWPWAWLPRGIIDRPLVRLGYVCRLQNGLTIDGKRDLSGDVVTRPYLRVANVQAGSLALSTVTEITVPRDVADRSTLRHGDVLMTEGGDLDKLGRGTVWRGELPGCLHQNHVFALRPDPDRLDGDYLALMTRTLHGRCYFESTGVKTTNLASTNSSKILSFPIPLPDLSVQRQLAKQAQQALETVEAASRLLNRQRSLLAERRQALITTAVTGQFDVSTASGRNVTDGVHA
ncbi:hypothetical protein ACF1FX_12305 [Streptomyces sp. NPDC014646]|uniref:restriction endonuclease subunit S n=1 Tax=unclassified Streptomyces TaxID=2593676 RepID=UPI0037034E9E